MIGIGKASMYRIALAAVAVLGVASLTFAISRADDGSMQPAIQENQGNVPGSFDLASTAAVGTAFTYQGRLLSSGSPANGPFDLQFRLLDAAVGGAQVGSTISVDDAAVSDGRFTVELDFGQSAFGDGARWLEISVRPGAGGSYTLLSPRQKLSPAPYAMALPNVYTNESNAFVGVGRDNQVSTSERFGVHSESASGAYGGMYVDTSNAAGWPFYGFATGGVFRAWTYYEGTTGDWKLYNGGVRLSVASGSGLEIANTTLTDGLRINQTADDGAQIGNGTDYPNYGVYVPSPGVPNICLLVYTSNASNNYALYTTDNIEAGVITLTAQRTIAKVDGLSELNPGDVAVAAGVTDPVAGGSSRLALVRLASGDGSGVIGVVVSRLEWQLAPGKEDVGEQVLMPADGPARPGDLVEVVTHGVTDVRVQRGAAVAKGARVTAANTDGGVRALRVESLNGMPVSEGAPIVGVALADASGSDTVPIFVNAN